MENWKFSRLYCGKIFDWQLQIELIFKRGNNLTTGNSQLTFFRRNQSLHILNQYFGEFFDSKKMFDLNKKSTKGFFKKKQWKTQAAFYCKT